MANYTFKDLGFWTPYTPEVPHPAAPPNAVYFKNENGDDWYEFWFPYIAELDPKEVILTAIPYGDKFLTQAIQRDASFIVPANSLVVQISGVDPMDPAPHKLFEYKIIDRATLTLSEIPPLPIVSVASTQALIQLSRMPHDGSVVPGADNLLDATEALVQQSGDRELKTWFNRSQTWRIDNPNVQKIGGAFKLSSEAIQDAFNAASKIEE